MSKQFSSLVVPVEEMTRKQRQSIVARVCTTIFNAVFLGKDLKDTGGGGGGEIGIPRKLWYGCAAGFRKALPNPIYDLIKNSIPFYDHCGRHSCPKHNLCRAFVDGLINNDEKVASSK